MKIKKLLLSAVMSITMAHMIAQVNVDVNLNIKHSVNGVSDFGRERHITVHSTPTEIDWIGEEDKLDYFINDLDVYFGRDNGSSTWKFQASEEDENNRNHVDSLWFKGFGSWLKDEYAKKTIAHQYETKGAMIMGTNPHPLYPTLSWYDNGSTWSGWQPKNVETSSEWVELYLDYAFRKYMGQPGEPLPTYWEVVNEIDMEFMTGKLLFSSYEHIWEYHNLVKKALDERLGEKAPKVGGMTWGQHDFEKGDGIGRQSVEKVLGWGIDPDAVNTSLEPYYKNDWFQWDVLFQGFMDACPTMDFWSIHLYDWPKASNSINRAGPNVEAALDMIEWYDNYKLGAPKELIVSEFGSVSGYLDEVSPKRRAWENLKPFNSMFMQFLERPSHITLTMPFAPVKAEWGDEYDADGNLTKRYPSTLLDKDENGDWQWTDFLLWYKQWSDVDGTRVETKSSDRDVQVDAYINGNHVYLILNNLHSQAETIDLNLFGGGTNTIKSVNVKNLYFNESLGTHGEAIYDVSEYKTAPGSIVLNGDATIILDYTFENSVSITDEMKEVKYMCERFGTGNTPTGGDVFRKVVDGRTDLSAQVNNVIVPSGAAEAVIRIGGKFWDSGKIPGSITINGNVLHSNPSFSSDLDLDWRGEDNPGRNYWFGVYEIDVPKEYLQENNTITCQFGNNVTYTTVMLQVFNFTTDPMRSVNNDGVSLTGISLPANISLMQNQTESLALTFTPENATNKKITWESNDTDIATVDEQGVVTAISSSGSTVIKAISNNGNKEATITVDTKPYFSTPITGITINEGNAIEVDYYVTTPLHASILPVDATAQAVIWSSSDNDIVEVDPVTGKVLGKVIGESAIVTASIADEHNGDAIFTESITVNVGIVGEETIYSDALPNQLVGNDNYTINVPVNVNGVRSLSIELIQDGTTILASQTANINALGKTDIKINLSLASVPAIGTNYSLRAVLKDGENSIYETNTNLEILDIIHVESILLNEVFNQVEINGDSPILSFVIEPSGAFNKNVTWTSSAPTIASIATDGTVTAHTEGEFTITVSSEDGNKSDAVTLNAVSSFTQGPKSIMIPSEISVFPNANYTFTADYTPSTLPESLKRLTWISSNPNIASIDANGELSANANLGSTTITAKSVEDETVLATCIVNVEPTLIIEAEDWAAMGGAVGDIGKYTFTNGIAINNVQKGDYLEYDVIAPIAGEYEVTFVAATAVADGVIELLLEGVSQGSVKLTSTTWDSFTDYKMTTKVSLSEGLQTIRLNAAGTSDWQWNLDKFKLEYVGVPFDKMVLNTSFLHLAIGNQETLVPTITVNGASSTSVTWSSSVDGIVSIVNGVITGLAEGTTIITATSTENTDLSASCNVTVGELSDPIVIEAEDFIADGGDYADGKDGGVNLNPGVGINHVNNGDWAEYNFNIAESGTYKITYYISCPTPDGNITAYVDGAFICTDNIPNNGTGEWDTYVPIVASSTAQLSVGLHTFKIEASGSDWQWNLDKIELVRIGDYISTNLSTEDKNLVKIFPNPTKSDLNIFIENPNIFQLLEIFSYTGQLILNEDITNRNGTARINLSALPKGMYILKLSGSETQRISFIKN
ncbi:Ig-like domain-containing protein [Saccharicrinis aurantiacus]|uniref:Ig-like domain-containing protein n=1 Tax=Saccharicrinis aurantiacus TaxID=1849719 RepID=UPI000838EE9F|nr:Ig-like domain-containing protein [Saccharicrinis aurantiacus]